MNPHIAARRTMVSFRFPDNCRPVCDEYGKSMDHCLWMLKRVSDHGVQGEKAHRWLGYAQGMLVMEGRASLRALKQVNLSSQDPSSALGPAPDGSTDGSFEQHEPR